MSACPSNSNWIWNQNATWTRRRGRSTMPGKQRHGDAFKLRSAPEEANPFRPSVSRRMPERHCSYGQSAVFGRGCHSARPGPDSTRNDFLTYLSSINRSNGYRREAINCSSRGTRPYLAHRRRSRTGAHTCHTRVVFGTCPGSGLLDFKQDRGRS